MSKPIFDDYFKQLTPDSVILTPNRRLATVLHEHYIIYQQQQSLTCWDKPIILPINAWLETLWQQYLSSTTEPAPLLLNATQAHMLWESILSSEPSHNLLQVAQTADALKSAWELIHQYQVGLDDPAFQLTEDYALCQQWMLRYQKLCREHHYIDTATLPDFLAEKISTNELNPPGNIALYGFTEVLPQHKQLLPCTTEIACHSSSDQDSKRISFADSDQELTTMARFAKATHEKNADATIGCVVLDLNERRDRVLQLFTQAFFPEKPFDINPADYPFNVSAGKSLGSYPVIATALQICNLTNGYITRENFSTLLLSPYIGEADTESAERAQFDAELRRRNIHVVSLWGKGLAEMKERCPLLVKRLLDPGFRRDDEVHFRRDDEAHTHGGDGLTASNGSKTFSEWAQHFNNKLAALGWPGEKSLSSEEYQVAQAWLSVLEEFSSLDEINASKLATHQDDASLVDRKTAWQQLRQIVHAKVFQPQSPKSKIQVLGLLEAAAVPFDYLWVAGMNDTTWPPQPKPHPFIPKPIQRQLDMPHATAERELSFCTTILKQFQQAASQLIFSHAQSDGKIEFKTSPLLQSIPSTTINDIAQASYVDPIHHIYQSKQFEKFEDSIAPVLAVEQKISGGADAIKQQAACPFRAFATHRLQARELEASTQGLNAKDRGIILHEVMQRLWDTLSSKEKLITIDESDLQSLINENIEKAIAKNAPPHHQNTNYIQLEKQRLNKVIIQWLELEKARPSFVVSTSEQDASLTLQGRTLSFRIDRIDTLADNSKLIIDYKSGSNNSVNKWFGDRPDEPQLPLYALIDPEHTAGISFAQLAAGNVRFKGISREQLNIPGIDPEDGIWAEKIATWRNTLEKLAADFIAGNAKVDPKRPSDTCKHCAVTPLCRIYEMTDPAYDDELKEDSYD